MADLILHVGAQSAQGKRLNNEDRFVADLSRHVFLVADGMGGQEGGEEASGLAAEIIPRVVQAQMTHHADARRAVQEALQEAHRAILTAGQHQRAHRKMGTTAVLAVQQQDRVFVAGVGDSPALLVRGEQIEQLTLDHTVADALARNGTLSADQARSSPYRNYLYKYLGCTGPEMDEGADVRPFAPRPGDRLLLASDGLTNFISAADLREGARRHRDPQEWADLLVRTALERGSKDNVTCVILAFDAA